MQHVKNAITVKIRARISAMRLATSKTRMYSVEVNTQKVKGNYFVINLIIYKRSYGSITNINYNPWIGNSNSVKNKARVYV